MATIVGTESTLEALLEDLIRLDFDAAEAYQAAIDRLENATWRTSLAGFKEDHLRHTRDLGEELKGMGRTPPSGPDVKSILTQGKVVIGSLSGDDAILEAMRTNEADTNTAYERAVQHPQVTASQREMLERGLEDERRHCSWILKQLGRE